MVANLKTLRVRGNISQQQLAAAIGVSQQSVNKYENHNTEPDIATLIELADYFRTSVDYLVGHTQVCRPIEPMTRNDLNLAEMKVIECYRKLPPEKRKAVDALLEVM